MIYLDNASTTKPCQEAVNAAISTFSEFGNPSSLHNLGLNAEKIIKSSSKSIANLLGCNSKNIIFTSGGTESNNTAVFSAAKMSRVKKAITTQIEHPSVLEPFKALQKNGWEIEFVKVDNTGLIDLDDFSDKLSPDTALVSVMHVNNEVGTLQPIEQINDIIREKCKNAVFHVDAVQGYAKVPLNAENCGADLISISSHKINGLKGCGALFVKNRLEPLIVGGGQQAGKRSGTENVTGISAFGAAAEYHIKNNKYDEMLNLRKYFLDRLLSEIPMVKYNGSNDRYSPYVLNMSFPGIKAEILLHSLEAKGIYVSSGSACSSNKPMPSHVLTAMGCAREDIASAIRFSFSDETTEKELSSAVSVIKEEVSTIRKYVR